MRVRLTDGTREVEITAPGSAPLPEVEDTARRLYALTRPQPEADEHDTHPIGFGSLDGVTLDSNLERSDQDDEAEQDSAR